MKLQSVLLVGDAEVCRRVSAALYALAHASSEPEATQVALRLHNKYYEAEVQLVTCEFASVTEMLLTCKRSRSIEGICLVAEQGCTMAEARLEELSLIEDGPDIRMLIVDGASSHSQQSTWDNSARRVCIEHCTEYCEVCTCEGDHDEALYQQEDPEGLRRVLDAFEAHIWPSMRLHATAHQAQPTSPLAGASDEPLLAQRSAPGASLDMPSERVVADEPRGRQAGDRATSSAGGAVHAPQNDAHNSDTDEDAEAHVDLEDMARAELAEALLQEMQGAWQVRCVCVRRCAVAWYASFCCRTHRVAVRFTLQALMDPHS